MSIFNTYRLYRRRPYMATPAGVLGSSSNSELLFHKEFSPTQITFKGRNEQEAMKKANKFWRDAELGQGSIIVRVEQAISKAEVQ